MIQVPYGLEAQARAGQPLEQLHAVVAGLQCALAARGRSITQDGYYGPQTEAALETALAIFRRSGAPFAEYADFDRATPRNATRVTLTANFRSWLYAPAAAARCSRLTVPQRPSSSPGVPAAANDNVPPPPAPAGGNKTALWVAGGVGAALLLGGLLYYFNRKKKR